MLVVSEYSIIREMSAQELEQELLNLNAKMETSKGQLSEHEIDYREELARALEQLNTK